MWFVSNLLIPKLMTPKLLVRKIFLHKPFVHKLLVHKLFVDKLLIHKLLAWLTNMGVWGRPTDSKVVGVKWNCILVDFVVLWNIMFCGKNLFTIVF